MEKICEHMKAVIDIVMFCAKQGIALRGHRENEEALNKGKFLELFSLIAKHDPNASPGDTKKTAD